MTKKPKPFSLDDHQDGVIAFGDMTYQVSKFLKAVRKISQDDSRQLGYNLATRLRDEGITLPTARKIGESPLFVTGIDCSILSPKTKEWKSINIRLRIDIDCIIDEPEETKESSSPLDDLREN